MLKLRRFNQQAAFLQVGQHELVRILDEHARPLGLVGQAALRIHQLHERQVVFAAHARVVLAERRGDMNYSRAVGQGNVIVVGDVKRFLSERSERVREHRLVFDVFVILAFLFRNDFVVLEERGNESLGKNVNFVADLDFDVIETGVHTERDVGGQSPGSGCPHEKISVISALDFKFHVNGFFLYVFVALRHFVRRKRRSATRTIRNDFMSLIKQTFFGNGFERPPHRFDIIVVIGDVRMLHIHPVTEAVAHLFPFVGIFPDGLLAFLYERFDTVFFDILFAVEPEFLFDFEFYGKSVSIPARFSQNVLTLHRLISRNNILHNAR